MHISFKPNTYNTLKSVLVNGKPFHTRWVVCAKSNLYTISGKVYVDIELTESQINTVSEIMSAVRRDHPGITIEHHNDNVLKRVLIPTQYGHISVPLITVDNQRLLGEHIAPNVELDIEICPTQMWISNSKGGLLWTIFDVVANVTYQT